MEIGMAKFKNDGSVTIPYGMRRFFKKGETLVVLADEKRLTIKRASDVSGALRAMAGEPNTSGVKRTAKPPIKMPKRGPGGMFLPAGVSAKSRSGVAKVATKKPFSTQKHVKPAKRDKLGHFLPVKKPTGSHAKQH